LWQKHWTLDFHRRRKKRESSRHFTRLCDSEKYEIEDVLMNLMNLMNLIQTSDTEFLMEVTRDAG